MIFEVDSHRSSLSLAGVDALGRVVVAASYGNRPSEHHNTPSPPRHGGRTTGFLPGGSNGT